MINELNIDFENHMIDIVVQCPICKGKKKLEIPSQIINQSNQLSTVSIPSGFVCKHTFQAFIDKNFKVRGYQKVDFELSRMEIYDGGFDSIISELENEQKAEEVIVDLSSSPIFQDIIKLLRNYVDGKDILGSALFTVDGRVLYSSLSIETLYNTIKEFEVRNNTNLIMVKKYYLVLENQQKIFSQFIQIANTSLIITLIFSGMVRLGMGDLHLKELIKVAQKLKK